MGGKLDMSTRMGEKRRMDTPESDAQLVKDAAGIVKRCFAPKELSDRQMAPLVVWAHSQKRGTIQRIADEMARRCTSPVNRNMVGKWLNIDADKRQQPSHGYALLMAEVIADLQEEDREAAKAAAAAK